jgi:hypothetical protein
VLGVGLYSYGFMQKAFPWLVGFIISQLALMALAAMPLELGKVAATAVKFEFANTAEKDISVVRCLPRQRPVYMGDEAKFYARIGNTTQELNPREAEDYIAPSLEKIMSRRCPPESS